MTLSEQVDRFINDTNIAHMIIHGDSNTVVQTEGGPVRSFAKVIADADLYLISGVDSLMNIITSMIPTVEELEDALERVEAIVPETSENPPVDPIPGKTWIDSTNGRKYIWIVDVDGGQWVEAEAALLVDNQTAVEELITDLNSDSGGSNIGYKLNSSATSRTVLDRLQDIKTIRDFGIVGDGSDELSKWNEAYLSARYSSLYVPDGTYNLSALPTYIDDVILVGTSKVNFTNVKLPISNGVYSGNREIAIVAGVIRYYAETGEWKFLKDAGENHDPILLGPVTTATGTSGNVSLKVNLNDFGLNPTLWTPAGFVCGPDDDFAQSGANFGASVGTTSISIEGSTGAPNVSYIQYIEGTGWTCSAPTDQYTFNWINDSNARLQITIKPVYKRQGAASPNLPIITPRLTGAEPLLHINIGSTSMDVTEVNFFDATGSRILTPTSRLKFYMMNPGAVSPNFNFNNVTAAGSNIWMVGVFVRRII